MTNAKAVGYSARAVFIAGIASWPMFTACVNAQVVARPPVSSPIDIRVPFEPTAFPSNGHTYLFYELHIRNIGTVPLTLRRIEVFDAAHATGKAIVTVEGDHLDGIMQAGGQTPTVGSDRRQLNTGSSAIAFMSVAFTGEAHVPDKLVHRVVTADFAADGATIGTRHTKLHVLGPPLEGAHWLAADGVSNEQDNHHRRGVLVIDGRPVISRRYAIDWKQVESGTSFSGDAAEKASYHAYGKSVLAVAKGRVITARDGLPDNVPRHDGTFQSAVPITVETVAGNTITLDLGDGQFAYYGHLQPGSLRVKVGERVRRGQVVARVGGSGDAREPHLHFEVTTEPRFLIGEGVPYLIDNYRVTASDGVSARRTHELPLNNTVVDFGRGRTK